MNRLNQWIVLAVVSLVVTACGGSTTTSSSAPVPTDPTIPTPTPVVTETKNTDPRIPNLTKAARFTLADLVNFTGLQEIVAPDFIDTASIVGDPKFLLEVPAGRSSTLNKSNLLFAVEDRYGLWWMKQSMFKGTGTRTATSFDAIYADDFMVSRVRASLSGDDMNGTVYYRIRQSGENECKAVQICTAGSCNTQYDVNTCQAYMDTNNSYYVKNLGSFQTKYSLWATLPEGQ